MVFDAQGNLYLADYTSVRKIDPSGTITTVAGTGRFGFSGDGGPATQAKLTASDIALDGKGNLYISDTENNRIRMVNKDGIIRTVAGSGEEGYSSDGGPATKAALNLPIGIALDSEGNLFIACHHNSRVRMVDRNRKITTVAGTQELMSIREKRPATKVAFDQPWGMFFDEDSGDLCIADAFNSRIRALGLEGG
jgi:sugar lactone lactonase YvrE